MYIKVLDGRHAGEVRDIENGTALELLAAGRAAKAFSAPAHTASVPRIETAAAVVQVLPAASVGEPPASRKKPAK